MTTLTPRRLHSVEPAHLEQLTDVLVSCVEGGASVGFMAPLARERAMAFWRGVAEGVHAGARALLVAEDADGICGTVQLVFDLPDNQPHRADLTKMLVHQRARRRATMHCPTTAVTRIALLVTMNTRLSTITL